MDINFKVEGSQRIWMFTWLPCGKQIVASERGSRLSKKMTIAIIKGGNSHVTAGHSLNNETLH